MRASGWRITFLLTKSKEAAADVVEALLRTRELVIERADVGYLALSTYRGTGADFSDALILHGNRLAGCFETLTFDMGAVAQAGMRFPAGL